MRRFRKFRDARFALTTLQNPLCEVRTYAELCQDAQRERENQQVSAEIPAPQPSAAPPPPTPQWSPAALAPVAPSADEKAEPAKSHATEVILPVRKAVMKRAKRRPPLKASRHSKKVQLAEVVPTGDAAQYVSEIFDRHITKSVAPHRDGVSDPATLEHHSRKCVICNHSDRADIEEDFVSWHNVELIQRDYDLGNYRAIYRHARATGLYQRRRENLRFAAELLIEHADQVKPSPDAILRAIQICARLSGQGEWVEPAKHVIFSSNANAAAPEPEPESQAEAREEEPPNRQLPTSISSLTDTISINTHNLIDTGGD